MDIINRDRPRILITTKSTGRITHQIFIGDFSFDRRSVKPDGTAFFKCKERYDVCTLWDGRSIIGAEFTFNVKAELL